MEQGIEAGGAGAGGLERRGGGLGGGGGPGGGGGGRGWWLWRGSAHLMCGGFNSTDAGECERFVRSSGTTAVPVYAPQLRLAAFVLDGMNAGLSESGLAGERVELTAALRIALETPEAVERFLAGEGVF